MKEYSYASDPQRLIEKKQQRKRFLVFGLSSGLALLICVAVVIAVTFSQVTEGIYEFPEEAAQLKIDKPADAHEAMELLTRLLAESEDNSKTYFDKKTELEVDYSSVEYSGSSAELNLLHHFKSGILDSAAALLPPEHKGSFNDGYTDGASLAFALPNEASVLCEEEDDREALSILLSIPAAYTSDEALLRCFGADKDTAVREGLLSQLRGIVNILSVELTPFDFNIKAGVDCLKGQLCALSFVRCYRISMELQFEGELASLGVQRLSLNFSVVDSYDYTWAEVKFSQSKIELEKGISSPIGVNAVVNDYADYEVSFSSSDESVATIDEIGYITGHNYSSEPVYIEVTLKYLGNEYKDVCEVYVIKSVTRLKLSQKQLKLSVGETAELFAELTPENATIRDIIWLCDNEAIVSLTQTEGRLLIAAESSGTAVITAVARDGHFKASCTITIE